MARPKSSEFAGCDWRAGVGDYCRKIAVPAGATGLPVLFLALALLVVAQEKRRSREDSGPTIIPDKG